MLPITALGIWAIHPCSTGLCDVSGAVFCGQCHGFDICRSERYLPSYVSSTVPSDLAIVKQEIARIGVLPYPEFWARTTHRGTPGAALFLHWVFSVIFIVASPISNVNGYLVISTLFTYARTWVSGTFSRSLHPSCLKFE